MPVRTFIEERYSARIICHIGRRSDLLKVPGIKAEMFPQKGGKRRWATGMSDHQPGWFSTTLRKGGLWRVALFKERKDRPSVADGLKTAVMRDKTVQPHREALNQDIPPPATSELSDYAIQIAEGFEILPPRLKAVIVAIIDNQVAELSPTLRQLYGNGNLHDRARYEREYGGRR